MAPEPQGDQAQPLLQECQEASRVFVALVASLLTPASPVRVVKEAMARRLGVFMQEL